MSRLLLAASLLVALSTHALADRINPDLIGPTFARPPSGWQAQPDRPDRTEPARAPQYWRGVLDRSEVRAKLAAARAANLARFRAYQQKGVFPSNTFADQMLNVWRDEAGHLCAAATIINASGQAALVAKVAQEDNFIRLADVTDGPLMDWILTSGFTQAEIAAIQEPFSPVMRQQPTEPEPARIVAVDPARRRAEDARLLRKYRQVEAMLIKDQRASLEIAVDRLMAYPALARQLVRG